MSVLIPAGVRRPNRRRAFTTALSVLLTSGGFFGCESIGDRIAFNVRTHTYEDIYSKLTPEAQDRLRRRIVEPGDTPEMVLIAFGSPTTKTKDEHREQWTYVAFSVDSEGAWLAETPRDTGFKPQAGHVEITSIKDSNGGVRVVFSKDAGDQLRVIYIEGSLPWLTPISAKDS